MNDDKLKGGDAVRFNAEGGSVGLVEHVRDDGPFASKPGYYVRWYYGRNVAGERMTEPGGLLRRRDLVRITIEEFNTVADSRPAKWH
jgi:hypothetical protein